jgi:ligand-binding sensor domain-containing protein
MIWIGTNDGLNKYDGNKFTIYRNIPGDSTSISNNWLYTLYEDNSGQLWIGTHRGGLCLYNRDLDNFVRYVPDKKDTTSLSSVQVPAIYEFQDKNQSTLWIATGWGVNRFIPEKNNFKRYYPEGKKRKYRTNQNWIGSITQDESNRLWVGSWHEGLFYYDAASDSFIRYQPKTENLHKFKNRNIIKLHASQEDGKNILWMGTYRNGLYKVNLQDGEIKNFLSQSEKKADPVKSSVYDIYPGNDLSESILWLGTFNGLYRLNTENEQLTHFKYESGNPASLKSDYVEAVYSDKSGIVWIGSDRGVSILNPIRSSFNNIGQNSTAENNLINKTVHAVNKTNVDGHEVLWIGTSEGLHRYDQRTGHISLFEHNPQDMNSLSSNSIHSILKSRHSEKEFLWIGTINGLNRIDPATGKVKRYFIPDRNYPANWIWSLAEDETGQIWIGTQETSIYCFDPENEKFTRHSGYGVVYGLLFDSFGNLWTGLGAGLRKINLKSNKSTRYWHNPNDKNSICHNEISAIFESQNKILWVGTSSGLNKYNRETETFTRYTVEDGLPSNLICAILEDKYENLWISTGKGISKFNPEKNSFKNFDAGDGLQGNEFKYFSSYKNKKGVMFFGGTNGLTMFHPDKIKNNIFIPTIVLTDFQIFNKSIRPGINSVLKKNISETKEITLPYDQSVFSFEFAALDYHNPQKNKYAYQMEGVDPEWVNTDASRRFATYGSNNDGLWNNEGTSVKVIILPPWWKTNWAYSIYVIFIGFVMFGAWRFQTNRLQMKQQMEMQNFEADKLREVDKLKSHFFANISHEFRTPLTLISKLWMAALLAI